MFWGNFDTLWWVVIGVMVLTFLLVRIGLAHFRREELLGREIDVLRWSWMWSTFWQAFHGGAGSPLTWYRTVLLQTLRRLTLPALLITGIVIAGLWIGAQQFERFPFLLPQNQVENISQGINQIEGVLPALNTRSVLMVLWQNVRVLFLAMVLGLFSFGVLGVFPLMLTMSVTGYLIETLARSGLDPMPVIVGLILPHGVFEIPAAILATAAVLYAGAVLATPDPTRSVGQVLLEAAADWAKIMVGVVIPLLVVAAAVEVWVTPRIAMMIF
jgi:uncharacterized membrane protein SpoIIM required for sporulation